MINNFFSPENPAVYEINVGKYCTAGQATDDRMVHAHCTLDTKGCQHTQNILIVFHCNKCLHKRVSMICTFTACLVASVLQVHTVLRGTSPTSGHKKQELWQFSVSHLCSLIYRPCSEACQRPLNNYLQQK
jgi:hypothetical protein